MPASPPADPGEPATGDAPAAGDADPPGSGHARDAAPAFGPGGYLPERAAKRARKIVLREQMGLQWPVAAGIAALIVLVAGGVFLVTGTGPPGAPYAPVAHIDAVDPRGAAVLPAGSASSDLTAPVTDLAVVRAGGGVRVFLAVEGLRWCADSGRLESPAADGVWNTNGRLVGGPGSSLRPLPAQVYDGVLYVDQTAPGAPAPAEDANEAPTCEPAPS